MQVGRVKKNEYKPHLKKYWGIPSSHSAAFVTAMEDVLEIYSRPYYENLPLFSMDEKYPNLECFILVCDNLNNHNIAFLLKRSKPRKHPG